MEMQYFKMYSPALNRDMECKVYGHAGKPVLFIPCQDGRFFDFEGYKMAEVWSPWIESGQVMVIAIDTIDKETWSDKNGNADYRINLHEAWIRYITNEVVPFIQHMAMQRNGWHEAPGIMTFGCSLGATHAVNLFYRFPQHFDSMMALSGIFTAEYGFGSYMNAQIYENSPVHYLDQMPYHHPYVQMYNRGRSVICVGQGAWEQPETTRKLDEIFKRNGINTWVDYWGSDVNHDWPWWYKQVVHYLPWLLYQR